MFIILIISILIYDDENIFFFSLTDSLILKILNNLIYIISMTDSVLRILLASISKLKSFLQSSFWFLLIFKK